jgi:hypothetical protein
LCTLRRSFLAQLYSSSQQSSSSCLCSSSPHQNLRCLSQAAPSAQGSYDNVQRLEGGYGAYGITRAPSFHISLSGQHGVNSVFCSVHEKLPPVPWLLGCPGLPFSLQYTVFVSVLWPLNAKCHSIPWACFPRSGWFPACGCWSGCFCVLSQHGAVAGRNCHVLTNKHCDSC